MPRLFLIALFALPLLAGCDGGNNPDADEDDGIPTNGTMTATAAGSGFTATTVSGTLDNNNTLGVAGATAGSSPRQIALAVGNAQEGQTYTLGAASAEAIAIWSEGTGQTDAYTSFAGTGSGSITITDLSPTHAEGTFNFVGVNSAGDTRQITNGQFEVDLN